MPPVPGSIQCIVWIKDIPYFVILQQQNVTEGTLDPFAIYTHFPFPAKLYSMAQSEQLEIVRVEWVVVHVARWVISEEHCVILSLSRD